MKAIDKLKEKKFLVEITYGDFYNQISDFQFFSTLKEAEDFYNKSEIDKSHMDNAKWSREGEQPTFSIQLKELEAIPFEIYEKYKNESLEDFNDKDFDDLEKEIIEIFHNYSKTLKYKIYIFDENEKNKWKLLEY